MVRDSRGVVTTREREGGGGREAPRLSLSNESKAPPTLSSAATHTLAYVGSRVRGGDAVVSSIARQSSVERTFPARHNETVRAEIDNKARI